MRSVLVLFATTLPFLGTACSESAPTVNEEQPVSETPKKEQLATAKGTTAKDTTAKDTTAKDTTAKDTPAKDTPAKDTTPKYKKGLTLTYFTIPG